MVQRRGSYYYFGEQRLGQGRERALEAIKEDAELRRCLYCASFGGGVDWVWFGWVGYRMGGRRGWVFSFLPWEAAADGWAASLGLPLLSLQVGG